MKASTLSLVAVLLSSSILRAGVIPNGDFNSQSAGTNVTYTPGGGSDSDPTTFTDIRVFNLSSSFNQTATDISTTDGAITTALQVAATNLTATVPQSSVGFTNDIARISIVAGTSYTFSFDAEHVSGTDTGVFLSLLGYTALTGGTTAGAQLNLVFNISSGSYATYTATYVAPVTANGLVYHFAVDPYSTVAGASYTPTTGGETVNFTNLQLNAVPEPTTTALFSFAAGLAGLGYLRLLRSKRA